MANGPQTITTAAAHIDEVWTEGFIRALEHKLVIAQKVDRSWDFVGHGQTYHKSRIPNIESQTKASDTDLNATVYADTRQDIVINKHEACAIKHEDMATVLSRPGVKEEMVNRMAYTLGRNIDVNLAALAQNFSQEVGTLGIEVTYDNMLRAAQFLLEAGYDLASDVCWMFSTAQHLGLLKLDTFVHANYVGDSNAQAAHEKAQIGKFLNAPVITSNLIRSPASGQHENFLFHKETIALIMAQEPKTTTERLALGLSDVVVQDQIYGYAEINRYSEAPGNIEATDEGAVLIKGV